MTARRKFVVAGIAVGLMLSTAGAADAAVRYASPTGVNLATCPQNDPCSLQTAVEVVAVDNDEVIVTPGVYNEGGDQVTVSDAINLHGADGQARPTILSIADTGVLVNNDGATVRRLGIEHTGANVGVNIIVSAGVEQLVVHSTVAVNSACELRGTDTDPLRDSVCWNEATNSTGLEVASIAGGPFVANIRNVTAIATGTGSVGLLVKANADNQQTLVAKNVIADGPAADAKASAVNDAEASAIITLSSSNYATEQEMQGAMGTATVTDPGPPNQIAAPLFTDAALGLFHQAAGSPTIDAGAVVDLMGSADIDAQARTIGAAPDIGADEFEPLAAPPATNPTPTPLAPTTPKRKCKKGRKLKKGKCVKKKRKKRAR